MITITKDMETGIAKVDEQHRELVNRINAVVSMGVKSMSNEETQKTLDLLSAYVIKHFGDEEALQQQSKYPKYQEHSKQHKIYIGEINKLKQEFAQNGSSAKFTLDLSKSIIDWIVRHIKSSDVEFGKFYTVQ